MINNTLKEHLESKYNKEENYKKILSKEKGVVNMKKKILNIAAIFLVIVITGFVSTQIYAKIKWNAEFKEYQELPSKEAKGALAEIKEEGYAEVLNIDYLTQDGIGVKINSILLTDDCLDIDLTFKFDKNIEVDSQMFDFGYSVYDENKNIYTVLSRMHMGDNEKVDNTARFLYEELGIEYDKKDINKTQIADNCSIKITKVDEENRTIDMDIILRTSKKFPQSKKLYIRIFDPGYSMYETGEDHKIIAVEDFPLSIAKWNFEIEVPDKFYERNTKILELQNPIEGIEFKNITISETSMNLIFTSAEYGELINRGKDMISEEFSESLEKMLFVTDEEGNKFNELNIGTTENRGEYKMTIDVGLKDFNKNLYINYNGQKERLVESK